MAGIFSVISKLFGNKYEKDIKKIKPTLDLIHAEHEQISSLSNDELREQTQILKNQINEFVQSERKKLSNEFASLKKQDLSTEELKANIEKMNNGLKAGEEALKDIQKELEDFLLEAPWVFVVGLLLIPSLAYGGIKLGLLILFGFMYWGMVGLWESAMETLALMGLSVVLSVIVGVMLGILCALSDRFEKGMKPVLDTMQVMPAFVYLIPAMFFFGIGGAPAILATMIYSMPPIIRLTNLGIRQVPNETIESATAFGSTKSQILFKVQIPLALPSIMMGVNQTIMMALALVVLATFIGAQGLGSEIWIAIRKLDVGVAMEGGLCVLLMMLVSFQNLLIREL